MKLRFRLSVFVCLFSINCSLQPQIPIEINATQLIADYQEKPQMAEQKYKMRLLNITTAKVGGIMQRDQDIAVAFLGENPNAKKSLVCIFDASEKEKIWKLQNGQVVNFVGTIEIDSNPAILVRDCKIK